MFGITAIVMVFIVSAVVGEQHYSDKYDYIDVDAILSNTRLRTQYYKCFAGTGPCRTDAAKFYSESLPEAIVTRCRKCTARQAINFDKITVWYTANEPENYNLIVAKAIEDLKRKRSSS